jgi:hypothetical protein
MTSIGENNDYEATTMTENGRPPEGAKTGHKDRRAPVRWGVGGMLAATLLFAFVLAGPIYILLSQGPPSNNVPEIPGMAAFGGTPVDLSTLDGRLAAMYRGVKAHGRHFDDIPCFCGCDRTLEHRHLLDCFVLQDGGGWESHATGCSVCQGEARMALELFDQGVDPAEVRDLVIDEYGMPEAMREMLDEEMR